MRGAYFWLDTVALVSLIPDTYLVQLMNDNNAFVAGRSSRLTRMIRVATRSSRAVRVAALMPRLQRLMGHKVEVNDTERLLEKKLYRIFCFLDEDLDGYVSRIAAQRCQNKLLALAQISSPIRWANKLRQMSRVQTRNLANASPSLQSPLESEKSPLASPRGSASQQVEDRPTFRHSQTQTAFGISQAKELMSYEEFA